MNRFPKHVHYPRVRDGLGCSCGKFQIRGVLWEVAVTRWWEHVVAEVSGEGD